MDSRIKAEADEYNADYYLPLLELYEKIIHGKTVSMKIPLSTIC